MQEERNVKGWVKASLEFGPIIAFFAAFVALKDHTLTIGGTEYGGFILATATFVPLLVVTTLALWRLTGRLSPMQIATLVLVIVFGGLSVWLNDERFFKMKPTIIYLLFTAVLGFGLIRGTSYLKVVMSEVVPLLPEGWMILTRRVTALFAGLAVANEIVWRTMSDQAWVNFKTFGLPVAVFAFFMLQGKLMERYGVKDGTDGKDS